MVHQAIKTYISDCESQYNFFLKWVFKELTDFET